MKIALTGGTGFIGGWLSKTLLQQGHELFFIHRPTSRLENLESQKIRPLVFDGSLESLTKGLQDFKPDVVIHLASLFIAEHKSSDVAPLIQSNIVFPSLLLEAMKESNCKSLINTGTAWQHFMNEDYNPVSLYAATKQAFEDLIRFYVEAHAFKVVHLHLTDSYGLKDRRGKLISGLKKCGASSERLSLSPGDQEIDLVHVSDVVSAFVLTLGRLNEIKTQETYKVSSGKPISLKNLVMLFSEVSGRKLNVGWGERPYRKREVMKAWAGGSWVPGWEPKVTLTQGLKELMND